MKVLIATKNQGKIEGAKNRVKNLKEYAFIMALTKYINGDKWRKNEININTRQ